MEKRPHKSTDVRVHSYQYGINMKYDSMSQFTDKNTTPEKHAKR